MPPVETVFGDLLRRYRREAGLSQEELAERAGMSSRGISDLERGARARPRQVTVALLAEALGLGGAERAAFMAARRSVATPAPGATQTASDAPPARATSLPSLAPARQLTQSAQPHDSEQPLSVATSESATLHVFLIVDVRGYTHFTVENGDEAARRLAVRFASIARAVASPHAGQVIELRGDEALVVFTSARQALRAAIALQARFAEAVEADPTLPLRVGIGLDAGEALPMEEGFRGAALNLAARLCSLAGPGETLASEGVIHLARKVEGLDYHDRGMVFLKGFADPVHVLRVEPAGASDGQAGGEAAAALATAAPRAADAAPAAASLPLGGFLGALPSGPLVARQEEVEHILGAIAAVEAGAGRLLLLTGEPGIGKTRLAQEITLALRDHLFTLGVGRCYVPERAVAYYPFINALAMLASAAPGETRSQLPRQWLRLARLLPNMPQPPGAPAPAATPEATGLENNQDAEQQRLFWEVSDFILTLAKQRPVALLLDDLHWADSASLGLLKHLARQTRAAQVFMLGTARDVETPRSHPLSVALSELERERLVERMSVRRLSAEGTGALVAAALGASEIAPALTALLYGQTDGNAFFTQEALRALVERGDVYQEHGRWASRTVKELAPPDTVRGAIAERVARLSEQTQEALAQASVLGQTFAFDDLRALLGWTESQLETALDAAVTAGLAREVGQDRYGFRHALIQQALYAELSSRRKLRLHRAVGEALERLAEPVRERRIGELAFHFARSDAHEKALAYLLAAAERAHVAAAHLEEVTLLGQALELLDRLERRDLAVELHWRRGLACSSLDQWEESVRDFEAALTDLAPDQVERRVEILVALAEAWLFGTSHASARPYAEAAMALAEQVGRDDLMALATSVLGHIETSEGNMLEGNRKFDQAFAGARLSQMSLPIAAIDQYGLNLYYIGRFPEAAERLEEVLDFAQRTHAIRWTPRSLGNLLLTRAAQGRYTEAQRLFEATRQFAREYGTGRWVARTIAMWGGVHLAVGDYAEAEALAEEARELARSVGFPQPVASAGLDLLFNYTRRRDVGRTETLVDSVAGAVANAQGAHGWLWRMRLAQARAEIALARGEYAEAVSHATDALAKAEATGRVKYSIFSLTTRGQALAAAGRTRPGLADVRRALALARDHGDPAVLLRVLGALLEMEGDDHSLAEARATVETITTALPDDAMRHGFQASEPARLVGRLTR